MNKEQENVLKKVFSSDVKILGTLHGGMMNEAYVISDGKKKYVFYCPTAQANEMVDRNIEKETQDIAEGLNVTRKTIYFDVNSGMKISEFIDGNSLNHINDFSYMEVAKLFYKFHSSKKISTKDYNPLDRLESFKNEASQFTDFDKEFDGLYKTILDVKNFLISQPKTLAHNDAQRSNIILGEDGSYSLIDFEFAMNNDPVYDLATFGNDSVEEGLELVKEYKKISPLENIEKRYLLWRIDISLQWYLVALIKHYRGEGKTHNIDFLAVAKHFLENAKDAKSKLCRY